MVVLGVTTRPNFLGFIAAECRVMPVYDYSLTSWAPVATVVPLHTNGTTMGNRYFGSKATAGLCQPLIALMPPHSVYLETHLGGGAIMQRKPVARRYRHDYDEGAMSLVIHEDLYRWLVA